MDTEHIQQNGRRRAVRPQLRPVWLVAALAGATLLGGCALNGDFGRLRPDLVTDDMHAWVGRDAVRSIGGAPSEFPLTDNERRLRDLGFALIQPAYERNRWDSVVAEYGLTSGPDAPPFNPSAYWTQLWAAQRRSEASSYAQIVADARNDVLRIEPFFATAARVVDIDRRRAESLRLVASRSGLSEAEAANALNRNNENSAVIEWVCRSLYERATSYRFALERLVISTPSSRAADVDLALNLLQSRIAANCPGERPLVVKG
ncbi:MAG TPA: hypothetical protein VGN55_00915 [Xanthobacteraceae bacterium]|jgi:hypothetical protein